MLRIGPHLLDNNLVLAPMAGVTDKPFRILCKQLGAAARHNVEHGAQLIDINMGCPAKKVCNAWAGSALMRDEAKVARILDAVVSAVDVPVTLKIRTGWAADRRNALAIAHVAEAASI